MPFVVVPEQHPLQQKERVTGGRGDYPFISLQAQFTQRLLRDMHGAFRELSLNPYNEVTFMTTALAMVSANLGITVCLPYAEPMVKLYKLHMRALHEPELTRRFFVYTKTGRSLSPAAESFMAFLSALSRARVERGATRSRDSLPQVPGWRPAIMAHRPCRRHDPACRTTCPHLRRHHAINRMTIRRLHRLAVRLLLLIYKADFPKSNAPPQAPPA